MAAKYPYFTTSLLSDDTLVTFIRLLSKYYIGRNSTSCHTIQPISLYDDGSKSNVPFTAIDPDNATEPEHRR